MVSTQNDKTVLRAEIVLHLSKSSAIVSLGMFKITSVNSVLLCKYTKTVFFNFFFFLAKFVVVCCLFIFLIT